jgi:hypothetical protein
MQSVTVSLRAFLPVRVENGWLEPWPEPDPDDVCELGGIGLIGPVVPPVFDWPSLEVAVALLLVWLPDVAVSDVAVDASPGVVDVPPCVVDWPVVAVPVADVAPVLVLVLPGVWVCVDAEPPVGGNRRDGGNTSVLERLGVTGPLDFGDRAGAPLPVLLPGDVVPVVEVPVVDWARVVAAVKLSASVAIVAVLMAAPGW